MDTERSVSARQAPILKVDSEAHSADGKVEKKSETQS